MRGERVGRRQVEDDGPEGAPQDRRIGVAPAAVEPLPPRGVLLGPEREPPKRRIDPEAPEQVIGDPGRRMAEGDREAHGPLGAVLRRRQPESCHLVDGDTECVDGAHRLGHPGGARGVDADGDRERLRVDPEVSGVLDEARRPVRVEDVGAGEHVEERRAAGAEACRARPEADRPALPT